jgi:hypothetical protein
MNPLKFRVFKDGKMIYSNEYNMFYEFFEQACLDEDKAMSFTGLIDRNGRYIYEGDVMASRGNYITDELDENGNYIELYCVVVWNTYMSRFGLIPVKDYKSYKDDEIGRLWCCSITTFKEVIRTIFDEPTLEEKNPKPIKKTDLEECEYCGEIASDGRICHRCGIEF